MLWHEIVWYCAKHTPLNVCKISKKSDQGNCNGLHLYFAQLQTRFTQLVLSDPPNVYFAVTS